jgi:hypothetical protein
MVFGCIGTGDQNNIRFLDILDGVGHRSASERCGQTGHCGAMSEPGAMIDVVCLQHPPANFCAR